MADIFISYSSKDRRQIKQISAFFESEGWTTWWDPKIPVGQSFESVLLSELEKAGCVVVIWTKNSLKSSWVMREAKSAINAGKLVSVIGQPVPIPGEFHHLEAASPESWINSRDNEEILNLVSAVNRLVPPSIKPRTDTNRSHQTWSSGFLYILLSLFAAVILYILYLFALKGWALAHFEWIRIAIFAGITAVLMVALYNKLCLDNMILFPGIGLAKRPSIWLIPLVIFVLNIGLMPVTKIFRISGKLKSTIGSPVVGAQVSIDGTRFYTFSHSNGDFMLEIDNYDLGDEVTVVINHSKHEDHYEAVKLSSFVLDEAEIILKPADSASVPAPIVMCLKLI